MASIADDIFRRSLQGQIREVGSETERQEDRANQTQIEPPENKGLFGGIVDAAIGVKDMAVDIYKGVASWITKPTLGRTIEPLFGSSGNGFSNVNKTNVNYVGRNSSNEYEALAELKKQGVVENEQQALITLKKYYNRKNSWEAKYFENEEKDIANKDVVNAYQKELEQRNQALLDNAQKNIFSNSQKNIGDFAALRATQENRDTLNSMTQSSLTNLYSIKEKEEWLRAQGEDTSEVEAIRAKAERVYELGTKRQIQLAEMMSKYEGRPTDVQKKVGEEVRKMGYKDINDFITRDFKEELQDGSEASMADYLLNLNNKANWQRQKKRDKDGVDDYLKMLYWGAGTIAETATLKYVNTAYNKVAGMVGDVTGSGVLDFAEADVSRLGGTSWTRDGKGQAYDSYLNRIVGALPETASFFTVAAAETYGLKTVGAGIGTLIAPGVGTVIGGAIGAGLGLLKNFKKGSKIASKVGDILDTGRTTLNAGSYTYRAGKAMGLADDNALKFARHMDNATYTITKRVPEEVVMGFVGNAFDPEKGSDTQEHFATLDVALGLLGGAYRGFTRIRALNEVLDTAEGAAAFKSKFITDSGNPNISRSELETFYEGYKQTLKATERLVSLASEGKVDGISDVGLLRLTKDELSKEAKKAYARSWVRDLYIKRGEQLSPADIQLVQSIQKLVDDPKLNVADLFKITRNHPGGLNVVGFQSKVKVAADRALETPEFKYGKTVDEVFRGVEGWKPDSVITRDQVAAIKANTAKLGMYEDLFPRGIDWNQKYFQNVGDDGITLTEEGYKYLGIMDNRSNVEKLIASDSTLSVTNAIRTSAERTGDLVPKEFLQTLERTNVVEKLISLNCR